MDAIEREFAWYTTHSKAYDRRVRAIANNAAKGIVPGPRAIQTLDKLRPDQDHSKLSQWIREALAWKMPLGDDE